MLWSHPHKPLSFNAKPRSHHWKLQTDGIVLSCWWRRVMINLSL
uniref:Uncharacterized protein n=1 Tax=Brassica oleracea TaxID=3712 RepID=A0A3P6ED36_BRAOL|nr:unnamed protein product [Brassica oleracea]